MWAPLRAATIEEGKLCRAVCTRWLRLVLQTDWGLLTAGLVWQLVEWSWRGLSLQHSERTSETLPSLRTS